MQDFDWTPALDAAEGKSDARTKAWFKMEPLLNREKTKAEARPIYEMREWVYILVPGGGEPQRFLASEKHRKRFPKAYKWFQDLDKNIADGTPIDTWTGIDRLKAEQLKWYGVTTVEELAAWDVQERPLSHQEDVALIGLARDHIAGKDKKDREIDEKNEKIAELEELIEAMNYRLSELEKEGDVTYDATGTG